jgi:hypothetical protein
MSKRKSTPTTDTTPITLTFPARFYGDHSSRDLPSGTVVKDGARQVQATVTPADLYEIVNDALFYSDHKHFSPVDSFMWGIIDSARNTVPSLVRQLAVLSSGDNGAAVEPFWQATFDAHVKAGVTPIGPSPWAVTKAVGELQVEMESPEFGKALNDINGPTFPSSTVDVNDGPAAEDDELAAKRAKRNAAAKARRAAKKAQA